MQFGVCVNLLKNTNDLCTFSLVDEMNRARETNTLQWNAGCINDRIRDRFFKCIFYYYITYIIVGFCIPDSIIFVNFLFTHMCQAIHQKHDADVIVKILRLQGNYYNAT